mmetsp:Transcript_736/g.1561  ORF Transcript_736/g.1561 Transcript_736/m.1561 type:complete len:130 (+) Transcript_736:1018-1407(+)
MSFLGNGCALTVPCGSFPSAVTSDPDELLRLICLLAASTAAVVEAEGAGGREVVLSVRERGVKERWILSGEGGEREEGGGEEDAKEEGRRVRCGRPDEDPSDDIVYIVYVVCYLVIFSVYFFFLISVSF